MLPRVIVISALLLAAACVARTPVSSVAAPGPQDVDPALAAEIFNAACVRTLPDFASTPQALAAYPFTRQSNLGTFYHDRLDLSVKLIGQECSLVFGTVTAPAQAIAAFGAALNTLSPDPDITVSLTGLPGPGGTFYINARTKASQ